MRLMLAYGTPRIAAASFALTRFPVAMVISPSPNVYKPATETKCRSRVRLSNSLS